jgi:hypothetical protein
MLLLSENQKTLKADIVKILTNSQKMLINGASAPKIKQNPVLQFKQKQGIFVIL